MPKLSSDTFTKAHQDHGHLDAGGGTGRRQESDAGAIDQSFGIGPCEEGRSCCNWIDPCWTSIIPLVMGAAQGQLRTNERAVESQMGIIHSETTPFAAAQFTADANQSAGAASANLTEDDKVGQPSKA